MLFALFAIHLAILVFPRPGLLYKIKPLEALIPISLNKWGFSRGNKTASSTYLNMLSMPPNSSNVSLGFS